MKKFLLMLAMMLPCLGAWAEVTKPTSGVYVISGDNPAGKRGKLAAVEGITAHPALSDITWNTYAGNSATPITNGEHWYVYQVGEKYVIYNLGLNKYLYNPKNGSQINFSDTPYLWDILVNSTNKNYNSIWDATGTYLCFACGKSAANRNVHFNNEAGDGGSLHTFTAVENGETTYAEDIAVVVSKMNPTFTLTDIVGNEYTGTYSGIAGVDEPTFTGVANITIGNKQWNGDNFTADITFPFPVSSETVINPTLIVNGASWSSPNSRKWRVVSVTENETTTDYVKVKTAGVNQDNVDALWAIYPSLNEGKFTVMIKNLKTNTFVKANPNAVGNSGNGSDVTGATKPVSLAEEGTAFEYKVRTGSNYHFTYVNTQGKELRLSMNSSGDTDEFLGVYKDSHSGNDVAFPDYVGNMTFPVTVSSPKTINPITICSFAGKNNNFHWYVDGNNAKIQMNPSITNSTIASYLWAIYPKVVNGEMTYTIKNFATGKFIFSNKEYASNEGSHDENQIQMVDAANATAFKCTGNNAFYYVGTNEVNQYLSWGSSISESGNLGIWAKEHDGAKNKFPVAKYNVTVTAAGYATLYTPIAGTLTGTARMITSEDIEDGYVTFGDVETGVSTQIPANQGAIVIGEGTYTFTAGNVTDDWSANLLKGSAVNTYVEGEAYVLGNKDGVGLYKALLNKNAVGEEGDTHFLNNAGKAYLKLPAASPVKAFLFEGGNTTDIEETIVAPSFDANAPIYDLSGRRVMNTVKGGIYIQNGKKFIVK